MSTTDSRPDTTLDDAQARDDECLCCYLLRMVVEHGCDNRLRWAAHWRDLVTPAWSGLEATLAARGGYCDCEVLMNVAVLAEEPEPTAWPRTCQATRPGLLACGRFES